MEQIPDNGCDHCLPDCRGTLYETSISAAPFRRCDVKNLGTSLLCNLDFGQIASPPIWGQEVGYVLVYWICLHFPSLSQVLDDYKRITGKVPAYLSESIKSNKRMFVPRSAVFETQQADETFYDAYEKDLAIAHFFLASPTVIQFSKTA